jgi:hypothetical protein
MSPTIKPKIEHSPTLKTIRMVENTIKNSENSLVTVAEIKKKLPKKVNHNVLKTILEYLEESGKIYSGIKGIVWVENNSPKMQNAIKNGYVYNNGSFAKYTK